MKVICFYFRLCFCIFYFIKLRTYTGVSHGYSTTIFVWGGKKHATNRVLIDVKFSMKFLKINKYIMRLTLQWMVCKEMLSSTLNSECYFRD